MSGSDHSKEQDKKHPFSAMLFVLIIFAVLASILFYQKKKIENDAPYDEFSLLHFLEQKTAFDLEKATPPRIIGNKNAPLKISEYGSFTCGACGIYHKEIFKKLKKDYIDTGKAYVIFNDVPRNVGDVTISAISRCVPRQSYHEFLELVFETQEEWMESEDPVEQIKEKAIIAGASPEIINQCYHSKELRESLVKNAKVALKKFDFGHIPALVINDTRVVKKLNSYEDISNILEEASPETERSNIDEDVVAPANIEDIETASGEEEKQNNLDIEKLAMPRLLANPDAPLKISDHSSYTCGACAKFHLDSFKKIKTEYIDTGKAYLVFDDFPRNEVDITIAAIARCVPQESYFKFVELIFKTQNQWMRNNEYIKFIKQNAKLTGADPDRIDKCAQSEELHDALAVRGQHVYEDLGVSSTPTFIINDNERIVGAVPYLEFKRTLESELAKKQEN